MAAAGSKESVASVDQQQSDTSLVSVWSIFKNWSIVALQCCISFCCIIKWISYACMRAELLQLWLTLCDPMDCSPPGSSVHGILQARILEWVAMPSSQNLLDVYIYPLPVGPPPPSPAVLSTQRCLLSPTHSPATSTALLMPGHKEMPGLPSCQLPSEVNS